MGKKNNRRHAPISVSEAEELLAKARRREAAQAAQNGHNTRRPARVDLATLDTPEISHGDLWDDFMMRPGTFYVADIAIPAMANQDGETFTATTTLKATDEQLPYLVEVLRQVRGALGETCRISLAPAERTDPEQVAPAQRSAASVADAERALQAARRAEETRRRATIPDGPPMVIGAPGGPWLAAAEDREYTREELVAQLPGRTRADVAAELGKAPEDIGGTYNTDALPEELAAQIGVPVDSLRRIPMTGGGHAWAVVPQNSEPTGRHAAMDTCVVAPSDDDEPLISDKPRDPRGHQADHMVVRENPDHPARAYVIVCTCGTELGTTTEAGAREMHDNHARGERRAGR